MYTCNIWCSSSEINAVLGVKINLFLFNSKETKILVSDFIDLKISDLFFFCRNAYQN